MHTTLESAIAAAATLLSLAAAALQQTKAAIEPARARQRLRRVAEMPLGARVGSIAHCPQALGNGGHFRQQPILIVSVLRLQLGLELGLRPDARQVVIRAGHQHRAGRRAARCRVEVCQAQAASGEPVEMGRGDLTAKAAQVRVTQIVGNDQQDVRRDTLGRSVLWRGRRAITAE